MSFMGGFDVTEPVESVQTALSFFGKRDNSPPDVEFEKLTKGLAKVKVQLEAKDSAYKQALIRLEHHKKLSDDLSTLLRSSDFVKEFYINESQESNARINELESAMNEISHKLSEMEKAKVKSKSALNEEKLKTETLMSRISEMNETTIDLKKRALETEKEKAEALSQKEAAANAEAEARKQLEIMQTLENQLLNKSAQIVSLQMELKKSKEIQMFSEKAAADAISDVKKLKGSTELQEKELKELRRLSVILDETKSELETSREKENDTEVEIALLKFELHKAILKNSAENKNENINLHEKENMKKELGIAMGKIGELRTRAEQAISRAEAAEKAKVALEDPLKRSKDEEKSSYVELINSKSSFEFDKAANNNDNLTLAEILNMKL